MTERACPDCRRRAWLLGRLAGHLDRARHRLGELLTLGDEELVAALAGRGCAQVRREYEAFAPEGAAARDRAAGLVSVCRCDHAYPPPLLELDAPPAVLHVLGGVGRLGELLAESPVAIVGARRASPYGLEVARALGRELSVAGVTVISGMARGTDSAAHRGVIDSDGRTLAVLAAAAERPYPASARHLHRRIAETGALVSELGPGVSPRRWMFPARNRIIAALSAMTVVVQGRTSSGALVTARAAADLGRAVGAVPGPVTAPLSAGPHALLRGGAALVQGAQDVLDQLYGAGTRSVAAPLRGGPAPPLAALLEALADGHEASVAFGQAGLDVDAGLAGLASLELGGWLRRGPGGRLTVVR